MDKKTNSFKFNRFYRLLVIQTGLVSFTLLSLLFNLNNTRLIFFLTLLHGIILALLFKFTSSITQHFQSIFNYVENSENWSNLNLDIDLDSSDELKKKILKVMQAYGKEIERQNKANLLDKEAQISALQSQINPHFLYNTLESIRGQALIEDHEEIASITETLAVFFRYNISQKGYLVSLREEIDNVKNYFKIQEYRFEHRFSLSLEIDKTDEILECFIPKLTIQPIIENAIFHGLETSGKNGQVSVRIFKSEHNLMIRISDNGVGISASILEDMNQKINNDSDSIETSSKSSSGIALINVNKRIKLIFGQTYGIQIYSTQGIGTDVEINLPYISDKSSFDRKLFDKS